MKHATISAYRLPWGMRIEAVEQLRGDVKWAVRSGDGSCMNRSGEMEVEPMPSNRDAEFMARCRFDTAEEAYEVWEKYN